MGVKIPVTIDRTQHHRGVLTVFNSHKYTTIHGAYDMQIEITFPKAKYALKCCTQIGTVLLCRHMNIGNNRSYLDITNYSLSLLRKSHRRPRDATLQVNHSIVHNPESAL